MRNRTDRSRPTWLSPSLCLLLLLGLPVAGRAGGGAAEADDEAQKSKTRVYIANDGEEPEVMEVGPGETRFRIQGPMGSGFIGIELVELSRDLRAHFGVPEDDGVMVAHVDADGPAAKAGIKAGDIITAVDNAKVDGSMRLSRLIRHKSDGEAATIELWRDGKVQKVTATVAERKRTTLEANQLMKIPFPANASPEERAAFKEAMGTLRSLDMPGLREKVMTLRSQREADLEKRLADLEKRLTELQKQLDERHR